MRFVTSTAMFYLVAAALAEEPTGFYAAYGVVDDQHFKSTASLEQIRKTPKWSPDTEQFPPLPPGRAQALARKQLDRIIPSGQTWYVDAVRTVAVVEGANWLYEVSFRRQYPPDVAVYGGDYVDVLVLMDGTSIEPKRIPCPQ